MRRKVRDLTNKEKMETLDALYTAASGIKDRSAMKLFLRDLLTESERIMLGRRILIAQRLLTGQKYDQIEEELRMGRDTIWRVHRWLQDKLPGFEKAIKEMEKEKLRREDKQLYAQSALYRLKKKYPLYFLLFATPKLKKKSE